MKKLPVPLVLLALAILLSLWLRAPAPEFAPAEDFSLVRYDGRYAAAYAVTPERAEAFVKTLGDEEKYAQLLQDLDVRVQRVEKRRAEEKAHRYNVRHGKK